MTVRTALITGSTSGIGLGIARAFAKAKYNIIFNGLEKNGSDIAASTAKEFQVDHLFSPANALHTDQLRAMVDDGLSRFKNIGLLLFIIYRFNFFVILDVLINNCGVQYVSPIESFPDDKWDDILRINLSSAFILTKALMKPMKQNKFGRIINIASAHGLFASEYKSAYVSAKHGVLGLTKVIALEGAPFNINCNAICPGYVRTPLVDAQIRDQAKSHDISGKLVFFKNI
jgi:3-hydroxybutyrate dehydrogenase